MEDSVGVGKRKKGIERRSPTWRSAVVVTPEKMTKRFIDINSRPNISWMQTRMISIFALKIALEVVLEYAFLNDNFSQIWVGQGRPFYLHFS